MPKITKFLTDLAEVKKVNLSDLHSFLALDHTSFSVLNVSAKHIVSTNRLTVSLTKNSARSFYLGNKKSNQLSSQSVIKPNPSDDCLTDAENCQYFQFFNSKEKKLYTRFKDNFEANFLCSCSPKNCSHNYLFLTGTYNTTVENLAAWTTNWDASDDCWNSLTNNKAYDLKNWAQNFDPQAEPLKVLLPPVTVDPSQFTTIKKHTAQLIRDINRTWKPSNWKWVMIFELQKNGHWHWHLFTTPFIPYSHKCVLSQSQATACWNCRTYLNKLWPYGRVESRNLEKKAAGKYMAKYMAKSFHLRNLYQEHGLTNQQRTYHFYHNLYQYESRTVVWQGSRKIDPATGQKLNGKQTIFRAYDYDTQATYYFYRTNKQLVGHCQKPVLIKKNYRLGTRNLKTLSLLNLAQKSKAKEVLNLCKTLLKKKTFTADFQEFLITNLLLRCKSAEFTNIPLEKERVSKEAGHCSGVVHHHFQTKPVLRFTFLPEQAVTVREFIEQLDDYAEQYDMEESKDFIFYPSEASQELWTPAQARNQYLDNWWMNYCPTGYSPPSGV